MGFEVVSRLFCRCTLRTRPVGTMYKGTSELCVYMNSCGSVHTYYVCWVFVCVSYYDCSICVCIWTYNVFIACTYVCVSVFVRNVHYVVFLQYIYIRIYTRTYVHAWFYVHIMCVLTFDVKYTELLRMYTMCCYLSCVPRCVGMEGFGQLKVWRR